MALSRLESHDRFRNYLKISAEVTVLFINILKDDLDVVRISFGLLVAAEFGAAVEKGSGNSRQLGIDWRRRH